MFGLFDPLCLILLLPAMLLAGWTSSAALTPSR